MTLTDALAKCQTMLRQPVAIALLYSPKRCYFGTLDAPGKLTGSKGQEIDLSCIFEARVFNENAELRWLNEAQGQGRAVLLAEQDISAWLDESLVTITPVKILDQTYLLWGQGVKSTLASGWSRLTAARIGRLDVPFANVPEYERVQLRVREYLADTDAAGKPDPHGNVSVAEERLISLSLET
jgi:CRISPR-associated protein (TIGR03984 family)